MQEQQNKEKIKERNGKTVLTGTDTCCTSATESLDNKQGQELQTKDEINGKTTLKGTDTCCSDTCCSDTCCTPEI